LALLVLESRAQEERGSMAPHGIVIAVFIGLVLFAGAAIVMGVPFGARASNARVRQTMRSISASQRQTFDEEPPPDKSVLRNVVAQEEAIQAVSDTRLTLRKRLKYAQMAHVPPYAFAIAQVVLSLASIAIARQFFDLPLQLISLVVGPLFVNWLLNSKVEKRFKKFDADYPQFLLSLVGLLKTGMNPLQALEAAAEALEPDALVRVEVEIMLERLKLGVSEERSIGSFGEDIYHPEIELFVQALILSRRVGGNLSDTLDRLAKQVRKRQYFRSSANAAVGLQRGSIWFILVVLMGLEVYLYLQWPECITKTWTHPLGRKAGQAGLIGIILGLWWVRQVTKLKV
jgi:tight adherence protein B